MSQFFQRSRSSFVTCAILFCAALTFFSAGCGSGSEEMLSQSELGSLPDETLAELSEDEQLIFSDSYAGYLVVFFDESLGARLDPAKGLQSITGKNDILSSVSSLINKRPSLKLTRGMEQDPKRIDLKRKQSERITGQKLADLNSIYHVETTDMSEAVRTLRELKTTEGVVKVYPKIKPLPADAGDTPNITGLQGYLGDLGVSAAQAEGFTGANATIVDSEDAWNYRHQDLINVGHIDPEAGYPICMPDEGANPYASCHHITALSHGTAIAGIAVAHADGSGITGIAPEADFFAVNGSRVVLPGSSEYVKPGSINIIPLGISGRFSPPSSPDASAVVQFGGLPVESDSENHSQISNATAGGVTVIIAAGNGSISLDDSQVYFPENVQFCPGCSDDSGSIIVGASTGEDHKKAHFSNSGSRVDLFAWGQDVVTTSYPSSDPTSAYNWSGTAPFEMSGSDINSYYTNRFGGTSSATAMIGGVAALVQSYAKNGLEGSQTRYLTPFKMREILVASSIPQERNPMGSSYNVCEAPGGVHTGAGSCSGGRQCQTLAPTNPERSCTYDSQCLRYGEFWTLSPQCISGRCGMSVCTPTCGSVAGGCASMGWFEFTTGGTCYCRPPFGTESMNNGNIGGQPRVYDPSSHNDALTRVDELIARVRADYPELSSGEKLTTERLSSLWRAGIGIICEPADIESHTMSENNDPICPEDLIWPTGNDIAKPLDFDGDGRADIVRWTDGSWKIDLSGRSSPGSGIDGFASGDNWDVVVNYRSMSLTSDPPGQWRIPYVEDFNSDGRSDLAVYDRLAGKWFIRFTDSDILDHGTLSWTEWDVVEDYSSVWRDELNANPNLAKISRPVPGDYNSDGWVDIAIACSDGFWRIDYNGPVNPSSPSFTPNFGAFDSSRPFLTSAQLGAAPGWAYLPVPYYYSSGAPDEMIPAFKMPDGLPSAGHLAMIQNLGGGAFEDMMARNPNIFGDSDVIVLPGSYTALGAVNIGLKSNDGTWDIVTQNTRTGFWDASTSPAPAGIFGDSSCRPIAADFDGDGLSDRAVMCPNEWRIAYSSRSLFLTVRDADSARRIPLTYDTDEFALPGRPYSGGISFDQTQRLIETYSRTHLDSAPPIPVDMP